MEKVINLGIPHVSEQIFDSIETEELIEYLKISQTWKILAENVLIKKWKGKMFEACENGETKVTKGKVTEGKVSQGKFSKGK